LGAGRGELSSRQRIDDDCGNNTERNEKKTKHDGDSLGHLKHAGKKKQHRRRSSNAAAAVYIYFLVVFLTSFNSS
jgi:hypothetical protein